MSICCILLVTGIQLLFAYPENHVDIWLVIMFLSRQKCHAMQMFMLSSCMKLGPGYLVSILGIGAECFCKWIELEITTAG